MDTKTFAYAGAVYIKGSTNGLTTINSYFRYNLNTYKGGALTIIGTTWTDTSSIISSGSALYAGGVFADKSTLTLTGTVLDNNYAIDGAAFILDNTMTVTYSQA